MEEINLLNKAFLDSNPKFREYCSGPYFFMRQHSDLIDKNLYDIVVVLGHSSPSVILKHRNNLINMKNTVIKQNVYTQLFVSESVFNENREVFNNEREGANYRVISSYNDLFKGTMRIDEYVVLANSDHDKFEVFSLINGTTDKIICNNSSNHLEVYGLVNIGHLVNCKPYTPYFLSELSQKLNMNLSKAFIERMCQTSLLEYSKNGRDYLSRIDLENLDDKVFIKADLNSKLITNKHLIESFYRHDITYEQFIDRNKSLLDSLLNGFIYLGLKNKRIIPITVGSKEELCITETRFYLLINYSLKKANFDFTIWEYEINNNNILKLENLLARMKEPTEANQEHNEKVKKMIDELNLYEPRNIVHTLKCSIEM